MGAHRRNIRKLCLAGTAMAGALSLMAAPAYAQEQTFELDVPSQRLDTALRAFAQQSRQQLMFAVADTKGFKAPALNGSYTADQAIGALLAGTGLEVHRNASGVFLIASASDPQSGSAAGDGAEVEALIVTAQKREEDIQDVPIAISAFTQEQLERSQVAGGPDLITQVPNMTFTKTNFSSYSIQLRGIGTQAISATVDPAVAVAFNNTPFIRNRFFEQEFYDLQRVEVLRGPQGTLYGRNATAGVVNLISAKPKFTYEAKLSGDVANYNSTRLEGMVNLPLVEDVVALRIAGAWTKREGYSVNEFNGNSIDGRDLWSTRVSLRFAPTDAIDANLIWEHFEEDDDRIRSGKQLCHTDVVSSVAGFDTPDFYQPLSDTSGVGQNFTGVQGSFSQGCKPASLYSPDSFQKTNALALPYYVPLGSVQLPIATSTGTGTGQPSDPYASRTQSNDLRVIEAVVDPSYRAKTDVVELQVSVDLTDNLTLNSETAWGSDFIFSTQDYNRFAGAPHAWRTTNAAGWLSRGILSADGVFCDPQIGCSDRLVAMDLSTAQSSQFSQELRLASDFDGAFNFSLGANYLRYDTEDKYYVFINSLSMISAYLVNGLNSASATNPYIPNVTDNRDCLPNGLAEPDYTVAQQLLFCTYIDPNPVSSLNDLGHNYFLSRNPYKLISYAVFGEAYYNLTDNLKVTAGLRWTVDKKEAPRIPSWLLASLTAGHPVAEVVEQEWRKPTGRLTIDWKPDLSFTDETLVYASYGHGYKAGGMNPPPYGKAFFGATGGALVDAILEGSALQPKTFDPEYVDAFELGMKNTMLDGALTLNLASFYYDYKGYQLSQIVNRSAVTDNFDSDVWGLELEADWRPVENLRLGLKLGYEKTKVADGEQAIDVMDRTAGDENWVLHKPFPTFPSNCVLPAWLMVGFPNGQSGSSTTNPSLVNVGGSGGGNPGGCEQAYLIGEDPGLAGAIYDYYLPTTRMNINYAAWSTDIADYPCWPLNSIPTTPITYPGVDPECLAALSNNGEGFYKDLGGKELPNAPHMTATLTADYTLPLPNDWLATLHTDLYYQSEAWTRIFNTEGYDKLKAYTNVNLAAIFTNEDAGWKVMAYVKNVFDRDSITGAFLNSDDSGLTTNIFLTEPRLYGIRVTKDFNGGPWWTGGSTNHAGSFPLTIELGGQVQRVDAPYEPLTAGWAETLPPAIALEDIQNRDLDWGDGRSVRLTYQPNGSPWSVFGSVRVSETNNDVARTIGSETAIIAACRYAPGTIFYRVGCDPNDPFYDYDSRRFGHVQVETWSDAEAKAHEKSSVEELGVGRDLEFGAGLATVLSASLRHVTLESDSTWSANAQGSWAIPDNWLTANSSYKRQHAILAAHREFDGSGPVLAWNGAFALWGDEQTGRVNLDWSVAGGVLFGDRENAVSGEVREENHSGVLQLSGFTEDALVVGAVLPVVGPPTIEVLPAPRSKSATVPLADLSLGLSYDVGRIKVGAGYRWERYFDALDVGVDEEKKADRTIDGPYFKLAIGFGS
ncbi:MAG TPA: TonB-dependent receptor [Caulobacteraceae bacterium]